MVVALQVFGQFERGAFPRGEHLHDNTGLFENRQVAVHRALRKIASGRGDLGGHQRMNR